MPPIRAMLNAGACWAYSFGDLADIRARYTITGDPTIVSSPYGNALMLINDSIDIGNIRKLGTESYVFFLRTLDETCGVLALNGIGDWVGVSIFANSVAFGRGASNFRGWNMVNITEPPNDGWHVLAITIPGGAQADISSAAAYLDGLALSVNATDASEAPTAYTSCIFGQNSFADLDGYLAKAFFFDRVLSPAECAEMAGV